MKRLRFAIIGAGFWARYQLAGWRELAGVECVAICDADRDRAAKFAAEHGVPAVYSDPALLLGAEKLDFVDVIASVEAHAALVLLAAARGVPVICQKPMGRTLDESRAMVAACGAAGVPLYVHENWRWQVPIRAFKEALESGRIGKIVRGRIDYANSFSPFDNQPFLKEVEQFILADMGTHLLDVARYLWGEADNVYCQTRRIREDIKGEDVATVMMRMRSGATVTACLSYASRWEFDRFPETFLYAEGSAGGVSLGADTMLRIFTPEGIEQRRVPPPQYAWADPEYALVHSSIVACNRNLLEALRGDAPAETSGLDNLKTLELVFSAYESAASDCAVHLKSQAERGHAPSGAAGASAIGRAGGEHA